jgi:hypothetical protein
MCTFSYLRSRYIIAPSFTGLKVTKRTKMMTKRKHKGYHKGIVLYCILFLFFFINFCIKLNFKHCILRIDIENKQRNGSSKPTQNHEIFWSSSKHPHHESVILALFFRDFERKILSDTFSPYYQWNRIFFFFLSKYKYGSKSLNIFTQENRKMHFLLFLKFKFRTSLDFKSSNSYIEVSIRKLILCFKSEINKESVSTYDYQK